MTAAATFVAEVPTGRQNAEGPFLLSGRARVRPRLRTRTQAQFSSRAELPPPPKGICVATDRASERAAYGGGGTIFRE